MNTFVKAFEGSGEGFSIGYYHIDYVISLSGTYITIRGAGGGGLMDRFIEGLGVKQVLSDIVQGKLIISSKPPRYKSRPIILGDEHGSPGTEGYISLEKIRGISSAIKISIKKLLNGQVAHTNTIVLCVPQKDLFIRNKIIDNRSYPLVFATQDDIDHILILMGAIDAMQSKYYPDLTI